MTHRGYEIKHGDMPVGGGTMRSLAIYAGEKRMAWVHDTESFAKYVINSKIATGEWMDGGAGAVQQEKRRQA